MSEPTTVIRLEADPMSASLARARIDRYRERLSERSLAARLLVSELVTNSVLHSAMAPRDHIEVTFSLDEGVFRADVTDSGVGFVPQGRTAGSPPDHGWGLHLVDRLADRWGVMGDHGARVWFELDTHRERGASEAV